MEGSKKSKGREAEMFVQEQVLAGFVYGRHILNWSGCCRSGPWSERCFVIAFGVHFSFILTFVALSRSNSNQIGRNLVNLKGCSFISHIFLLHFQRLVHVIFYYCGINTHERESSYIYTLTVCVIVISTWLDTRTCGKMHLTQACLGLRDSSTQWDATVKSGFFTGKERKSVLLMDLVFSLHCQVPEK